MKKKKVGRPVQGKAKKEQCSIRLEPDVKKFLIKRYGTLQWAITECIIAKFLDLQEFEEDLPEKIMKWVNDR